jgi:hypothetical protein
VPRGLARRIGAVEGEAAGAAAAEVEEAEPHFAAADVVGEPPARIRPAPGDPAVGGQAGGGDLVEHARAADEVRAEAGEALAEVAQAVRAQGRAGEPGDVAGRRFVELHHASAYLYDDDQVAGYRAAAENMAASAMGEGESAAGGTLEISTRSWDALLAALCLPAPLDLPQV